MKVQIGSVKYDMTLVSDEKIKADFLSENDDDDTIGGSLNTMKYVMQINKDIPAQSRLQTFFHECVHGMLDEIGEGDLFHDEDFVNALSKQIYTLFCNNNFEKIFKYLGDK